MNSKSLVTTMIMVVLILAGTGRAIVSKESQLQTERGRVVEGFQLAARLEEQEVHAGEPIHLIVSLMNTTKSNLYFADAGYEKDFTIDVESNSGQPVELTEYGRRLVKNRGTSFGRVGVRIRPGEALQYDLLLNKIYVIPSPGVYTVTVSRDVPKRNGKGLARVTSNKVTVVVTQ